MQFDEYITVVHGVGYSYRPDNGNQIFFDLSQNPAIPRNDDHPFELVKVDRQFKYIDRGNGRRDYFKNRDYVGWDNLLYEHRYSDGYGIRVDHDAAHRTSAIYDEKGQRAEFTYQDNVVTNTSTTLLTRIDIDTDYDGSTLNPEYSITYTYAENLLVPVRPLLIKVEFTDIANGTTKTTAEYNYDAASFPPKLVEVYDGRTNATGNTFPYATITYRSDGPVVAKVASVIHSGGADGYSFTDTSATNALGRVTNFGFTKVGDYKRLTSIDGVATANCLSVNKSISYTPGAGEPEGYIYSKVEKNGSVINYTRDARGLVLTKTEDAGGANPRVTTYTWHPTLRLPLTRTTAQMIETFTYNEGADGEVSLATYSQTDNVATSPSFGQTRTWTYGYTTLAAGFEVLTSVDGPGKLSDGVTDVTTYDYNAEGTLIKTTDPNGFVTEFLNLNKQGQPTLTRSSDGVEWGFVYDHRGRVISTTLNPNGTQPKTSSFTYDVIGQLTSYTDTHGHQTTYDYNEARRLVKITNPLGETANYEYDLVGNVTRTSYSGTNGVETFFEQTDYDALGRILKTTGAMGQIWQFTHDKEDNLDSITDPLALQISNSFDALNRLTDTVDRAGGTTSSDYNEADQRTTYTDPRSINTGFAYNGFGELLTETSEDRGTLSYTYNTRGLTASMTDARGTVSTYEYDDGGRLTAHRFPSSPSEDQVFTYDAIRGTRLAGVGKIDRVIDESGQTITVFADYDPSRIALQVKIIEGKRYTTRYGYQPAGNLIWKMTPSNLQTKYLYDSEDRIVRIDQRRNQIDPQTGQNQPYEWLLYGATYQPFGPLSGLTYNDGSTSSITYDQSYRLTGYLDSLGTTTLRDVDMGYSARDNLSTITDQLDALRSENFNYSTRELLASATGSYGDLGFAYDAVGNRTSRSETVNGVANTDSYTYPATKNRLQSVAGGNPRVLTYDAAGNVIFDQRGADTYVYAYNAANRMQSVTKNGVLQAEYVYNALGQQVIRRVNGQTIHTIHDLDGNRIAEYDFNPATQVSTLLREYIWMNGLPVAVVENGNVYYIRTDHIGRPVFATDATGAKVWEVSYLPFGGVHVATSFLTEGFPTTTPELRFPGQWFQSESGLHQNWMRDYDPTTGRYMQADPLGLVDGASVYGYARQNPGRYVDPRGEFIIGALVGASINLFIQSGISYLKYGELRLRCIDFRDVISSAYFGGIGVKLGPAIKSRKLKSIAGAVGVPYFFRRVLNPLPVRIGDECACKPTKTLKGWAKSVVNFYDNFGTP